jgi:hypothetical protein
MELITYKIEFLSGHEGFGWMEIDASTMTVYRIIKDDGTDVTHTGMSYKVVD